MSASPDVPLPSRPWLIGWLLIILTGCQKAKTPLPADWAERRKAIPIQEVKGFVLRWVESTGSSGHLTARQVQRLKAEQAYWELTGPIQLTWYEPDSTTRLYLTCQRATLYPEKGLFVAKKQVYLQSKEGQTLETDELRWDRAQDRLEAPGWVRIQAPKETIRGWGLVSTDRLRTYRLARIQGRVTLPAL